MASGEAVWSVCRFFFSQSHSGLSSSSANRWWGQQRLFEIMLTQVKNHKHLCQRWLERNEEENYIRLMPFPNDNRQSACRTSMCSPKQKTPLEYSLSLGQCLCYPSQPQTSVATAQIDNLFPYIFQPSIIISLYVCLKNRNISVAV